MTQAVNQARRIDAAGRCVPRGHLFVFVCGLAVAGLGADTTLVRAQADQPQRVEIPPGATTLEGLPSIRIDTSEEGTRRRVLDAAEAARSRVRVRIKDGQFFLASQDDQPLRFDAAGGFTYLTSRPGHYIRFTRINDKISYVEHLDGPSGTVTYWGELRVVIGR